MFTPIHEGFQRKKRLQALGCRRTEGDWNIWITGTWERVKDEPPPGAMSPNQASLQNPQKREQ
jgi:hypothetical protein